VPNIDFSCSVCGDGKVSMIQRPPVSLDLVPANTVFPSAMLEAVCFVNVASNP
jgi:hypothetical protein